MANYSGFGALFFKLLKPKIPFLLTLQEGDPIDYIKNKSLRVGPGHFKIPVRFFMYPVFKMIFKKADAIQAISNYLADFGKSMGFRGEPVVVPNGVDINKFNQELKEEEKMETRQYLGLEEKDIALITTSRLVIKNGVGDVIKALPELPENVKFVIFGEGYLKESLELLAKSLEVSERVIFKGFVSHNEMPKYLKACDIFIRPSLSEGFGNSFIEAMAAGLPVIATPVGGIVDFLRDGKTGYFCKPQDPESIAATVKRVVSDPGKNRITENAYKMVSERYDWQTISLQIKAVFENTNKPKNSKILLTTGIFPPEIGGPATYSALLEKELPKFGIEVEVLPFRTVRHLPKVVRHLAFFLKVIKQGAGKDLLYSQDPVSVGFPTMLAAKILRKPFLVRIAGDYAWEQAVQRYGVKENIDDFQNKKYGWQTELLKKIQTTTARHADKVINPSKYFCNLVSAWAPGKIKAVPIYNGIDFGEIPKSRETYEKNTIISAGRLVPWKGFAALVELMAELPEWKLFIAGDGPDKGCLEELIEKNDLQNRVFLLGSIPRKELMEKMQNCELFVLNTSFESFSFQVVEAMRSGVPVITTKIGNLSEIIEDGKEGILVGPDNKKELLVAVQRFQDRDFRDKLVQAALHKSEIFSVQSTLAKTSDIIKELAKTK